MADHVLGMASIGGCNRVTFCHPLAQWGMDRIVIGMDKIVQDPGMHFVGHEAGLKQACGLHVDWYLASTMRASQDCKSSEGPDIDIVGIGSEHGSHMPEIG